MAFPGLVLYVYIPREVEMSSSIYCNDRLLF